MGFVPLHLVDGTVEVGGVIISDVNAASDAAVNTEGELISLSPITVTVG